MGTFFSTLLESIVGGLVTGSIYGLIALGLVMVYRGSRVLNFAQVEIGTFCVYVTWWLHEERGLPWVVAALLGITAAGAVCAAFERYVVRRMLDSPRLTVAVATIGLTLLLIAVEIKVWGSSPHFLGPPIRGMGVEVFNFFVSPTNMLAIAFAIAVGVGMNRFLRGTDFGLAVLASAQDPNAVRMVGVRLNQVSLFTWVAAGVIGAVAVLLFEPTIGAFAPGVFGTGSNSLFVPALAAALLGGLKDLNRAFLAGLGVGVLQAVVDRLFVNVDAIPGASWAALFIVIVVALLLRPSGLASTSEVS